MERGYGLNEGRKAYGRKVWRGRKEVKNCRKEGVEGRKEGRKEGVERKERELEEGRC